MNNDCTADYFARSDTICGDSISDVNATRVKSRLLDWGIPYHHTVSSRRREKPRAIVPMPTMPAGDKIECDFFQHRNLAVMMRPGTTCSCITLLCEAHARRYDIAIEAAFGQNPISPW